MKKITLVLLTAVFAVPIALSGQTAEERIDSAVDRAEEAGIPVPLLESKVAEGRAKGIPMETIAMAVERRLDGLTRARAAMEGTAPDAVDASQLAVGADALESGVSEAVLAELAGETTGDRRAVAVAALTHLVGQGIVPEQALDQVRDALARGPDALASLPGFAGPPAGVPGAGGPPEGGVEAGPPASVPGPGQGGPPADLPGPGGPNGPPGGPPGS